MLRITTGILILLLLFTTLNQAIINGARNFQCNHPNMIIDYHEVTYAECAYNFNQCPDCGFTEKVTIMSHKLLPISFSKISITQSTLLGVTVSCVLINHTDKIITAMEYKVTFYDKDNNPIRCKFHFKDTHKWFLTGNIKPQVETSCAFAGFHIFDYYKPVRFEVSEILITFEDKTQLLVTSYYYNMKEIVR